MLHNKVSSLFFGILITIISTNIYASGDHSHDDEHKLVERKLSQFVKNFAGITTSSTVDGFVVNPATFEFVEDIGKFNGASTVTRSKTGANFEINAVGVNPNEVHTVWFAAYNKPEACATPCDCGPVDIFNPEVGFGMFWTGGRVADQYGQIDVAGLVKYRKFNNDEQVLYDLGDDPLRSRRANIQIVLRTHGVASSDQAILEKQLTEHQGGCDTNTCYDYVITTHKSPFCLAQLNN